MFFLTPQLGYSVESSKQIVTETEPPSLSPKVEQLLDDSPPLHPVNDCPPSGSKKTVSIKPRANKKPPSPDSGSDVRARLSSITDGLDANFRALMELHNQVCNFFKSCSCKLCINCVMYN